MSGAPQPSSRLDRPRSRRVHEAVLEATAELLAAGGLAAATTDAVSAQSGASKTTLYKHWPNRLTLAVEAFAHHMTDTVTPPDTGSTEGDLRAHMRMVAEFYATAQGRIYAELLAAAVTDPVAGDLLRTRFLDHRREVVLATWQRGIDRGEVDPALDFQAVNDVLFGPIIFRLVSGHAPLNRAEADLLADVALRGVLIS
ncbi:TetR-like C-terminal domain-containing protein [Williamsia phyllosphaerae]|uniref:TetR-like C-terminal domain-containing protein n=1 Tax=Williamsia phyllosphaerae TaxID=885042 RepID=UPI0016643656|nr:TetR-like C-terminal domain-containing protein [Williamsia phyllosphaerae]